LDGKLLSNVEGTENSGVRAHTNPPQFSIYGHMYAVVWPDGETRAEAKSTTNNNNTFCKRKQVTLAIDENGGTESEGRRGRWGMLHFDSASGENNNVTPRHCALHDKEFGF
jgi:hypothetical protein